MQPSTRPGTVDDMTCTAWFESTTASETEIILETSVIARSEPAATFVDDTSSETGMRTHEQKGHL